MYTEIVLDKPRRLRYDFNAIADTEARAGMGIAEMFSERRVGFHVIRLILWGGLKWQDKGLTIERVGQMIDVYLANGGTLEGLMTPVKDAMTKSGVLQAYVSDDEDELEDDESGADAAENEGNAMAGTD